jgi:hypothetical protein
MHLEDHRPRIRRKYRCQLWVHQYEYGEKSESLGSLHLLRGPDHPISARLQNESPSTKGAFEVSQKGTEGNRSRRAAVLTTGKVFSNRWLGCIERLPVVAAQELEITGAASLVVSGLNDRFRQWPTRVVFSLRVIRGPTTESSVCLASLLQRVWRTFSAHAFPPSPVVFLDA